MVGLNIVVDQTACMDPRNNLKHTLRLSEKVEGRGARSAASARLASIAAALANRRAVLMRLASLIPPA